MSHFTVVVAFKDPGPDGSVDEIIGELLAPYDEGKSAEPYRDYEKGEASEHWWYKSLRREAKEYAEGTGILPYDPKPELFSTDKTSKETPEEQLTELQRSAGIFALLPDPVTWEALAREYNARYGHSEAKDEHGERLQVSDDGRAYTMSTYNPDSKWDWWSIGGRWLGYFPYQPEDGAHVIHGRSGAFGNPGKLGHCDGGPKQYLALDALREEKAQEAREEHRRYCRVVQGTEPATPWSRFTDRVKAAEGTPDGYTIEQARKDYGAQPRIEKLRTSEEFKDYWELRPEEFEIPEDDYARRAADRAVPGYATVTHEGQWMAPGTMGWWGMSSDDEDSYGTYVKAANAYIDSLPEDMWLVALDCHI